MHSIEMFPLRDSVPWIAHHAEMKGGSFFFGFAMLRTSWKHIFAIGPWNWIRRLNISYLRSGLLMQIEGKDRQSWVPCRMVHRWSSDESHGGSFSLVRLLRRDSDTTLLPYSFHVIDSLCSFLLQGETRYTIYLLNQSSSFFERSQRLWSKANAGSTLRWQQTPVSVSSLNCFSYVTVLFFKHMLRHRYQELQYGTSFVFFQPLLAFRHSMLWAVCRPSGGKAPVMIELWMILMGFAKPAMLPGTRS